MSARNSTAAVLAALALTSTALTCAASAQVSSAPLGQVDPWGVGWLGRNDGALPATLWNNTTAEALQPIFATIEPRGLAPSARTALRRIMLSSARGPDGGASIIPERLRILEQLGETAHANDLRKRFPDTEWGKDNELRASGLDLVRGAEEPACARVANKRADDPDWMPVRAFCYALAGDFSAASMVGERLPPNADGKTDVWLLSAIVAMNTPGAKKPEGRYATPFDAAVSVAAQLGAPEKAFAGMTPDVAAAIALHHSATLEQKRLAMRPAFDAGLIKPTDVVAILTADDDTASQPTARRSAPRTDFLGLALAAAANKDAAADARATAYAAALKAADSLLDFRIAAAALGDKIKALPKSDAAAANAETFARAALISGDVKQAGDWRGQMDEKADPWAAARIDLLLSFAGSSGDKPGEILDRMIAAIPPPAEGAARAATPASREIDLRRIENTRALFLFTGVGRALSPDQRTLLSGQRTAGRGVSDAAISSITSAADQDADGEAALAAISLMGPDVSALSFAGLSDLLVQLRRAGFEKEADAIALESLQVWKAL